MADFVFNQGKGKVAEWGERINANDPANAVFIVDIIRVVTVEADSVIIDKDDFTTLVSGATSFATQSSLRKTIDDSGSITITIDDGNDRTDVDMPDITWTAPAAGDNWSDLVIGYDSDSTGGTDSNIVPATWHDFVITPDSSDITAVFDAAGFFRAA